MALAVRPLTFASAVVAAPGTSVAPSTAVPDNCTGFVVLNTSNAFAMLVGVGVPGVALVEGSTGTRIPAGAAMTFPIGEKSVRGPMNQSELAGSGLVFDAIGGAATADITYINRFGGTI